MIDDQLDLFGPDTAAAPASRATDPETSHEAASLTGRSRQRWIVLDRLAWGAAHDEHLARRCQPLIAHQGSVAKRRHELVAAGLAELVVDDDGPVRWLNAGGQPMRVHRITEAGLAALRSAPVDQLGHHWIDHHEEEA